MAWTKYGKFEEFRKELDETAKKLGRDAGINYHEWINYILKESKFYTVQKVQVNGNEKQDQDPLSGRQPRFSYAEYGRSFQR